MPDRIKLRRGPKSKIDLNVYELGYVTDQNEQRLYFNNGSIVPIPNNKDITDIKTELTKTANISNKNKQDIAYLKDNIGGIGSGGGTGSVKLVQHSYDIELSGSTKKVNIPYEMYSSVTDTLKVYVNGLAIQNNQYQITDPVEHDGTVTNGYIMLNIERPAGTIVRIEVWKNVLSGEEGNVSGNIIARNTLPLDRIIGLNDITSQWNDMMYEVAGGTATAITLNMPATLTDGYWKKFIASGNNNGASTTINTKPLYKVSSTNSPILKANRPYEIYYNSSNDCFFLKASATGTTSADKVLAGETFSTENDTDLVGTMPNKGAVTSNLNCGGSYTIPKGYHNGSGRVTANSLSSQTSANATANDIMNGKTAWVNGSKITGTATIDSFGGIKYKYKFTFTKTAASDTRERFSMGNILDDIVGKVIIMFTENRPYGMYNDFVTAVDGRGPSTINFRDMYDGNNSKERIVAHENKLVEFEFSQQNQNPGTKRTILVLEKRHTSDF